MNKEYRRLSLDEQDQLKLNGNRSECWNTIFVKENISINNICNNRFYGTVCIGLIGQDGLVDGDLRLPEGVFDSSFSNVTIGDHCAIHNVKMLSEYTIGDYCILFNIDEMTCSANSAPHYAWLEPMNENGGRRILPFSGMTIGDAYLWARYRGHKVLMEKLEQFTLQTLSTLEGGYRKIGDHGVIKNCKTIHNVAVRSSEGDSTKIEDCIALTAGRKGYGCHLGVDVIASRILLGEHVHLEFGVRLNDTVVGDNSTIARCEVGCSIIFPAHEQHHNNSFLIAALVMGQSNIAAGGTIGSTHNSRTADNEISAGRGFWPGLCCSFKHSSQFASYCLLSKADYPAELNITLPFALVNNNVNKDQLEVMPAYWWMYNMYAMNRNSKKFAARDKRVCKAQHVEFDNLAPDTAEEMLIGRMLLHEWTEEAYQRARNTETAPEILGRGMEHGSRKTVILKAAKGYKAYEDMLIYYAMNTLTTQYENQVPPMELGEGQRVQKWVNLGGQLIPQVDMEQMITDIESGTLNSWGDIHGRLDALWAIYPQQKCRHAYQVLCNLAKVLTLDAVQWQNYISRYESIKIYVQDQIKVTRHKDDVNPFRNMTYWDEAERAAVLD